MDKLAEQFSELAKQYAPAVVDSALAAARIEAYSTLVASGVGIFCAALLFYGAYFLAKKVYSGDWDDIAFFPAGICALAGAIAFLGGLWGIIDPWTWTAIYHPELWIAKQALHL